MTDENERTTDENEPVAVPVTPEPPPADVTPSVVTPPVVTPPATDADADDLDEGEDEEPLEATRLSPYAVASFALSLLALFQAPQNLFTAQGLQVQQFVRYVLPTLSVPVGAAAIALWLAFRGEEEIFVAGGRFGGVGFARAAKVISIGVILLSIAAVVLVLFFSDQPQQPAQFG